MNDQQTKKLNDHRALQGVFNNYGPTIAKYEVVEEKVNVFKGSINTIENLAKRTAKDTTGVTASKSEVKKKMATLGAELAAGAMAYAAEINDIQLAASFDVVYSEVADEKDEDALNVTRMLCDQLNAHIEPLGRFLVTQEEVTELEELADQFEGLAETKGSTKVDSKTAHKQLKVAFKEVDTLLRDQMDLLMIRLKRKEPALVDAYFAVRYTNRNLESGRSSAPKEPPATE